MVARLATEERAGAQPRVVLLHGVTDNRHIMRPAADQLRYAVSMIDLRGHGDSPADGPWELTEHVDDICATLDEIPLPVVLVGHSFGGLVAAGVAARRPRDLRGLVLIDPAIGVPLDDAVARAAEVAAPRRWPATDAALAELIATVEPRGRQRADEFFRRSLQRAVEGGVELPYVPAAAAAAWRAMAESTVDLCEVGCLVTLLVSRRGSMVPGRVAAALGEQLGRRLRTVNVDASHEIPLERPEAVADAVRGVVAAELALAWACH